jgi:hypothetical protein
VRVGADLGEQRPVEDHLVAQVLRAAFATEERRPGVGNLRGSIAALPATGRPGRPARPKRALITVVTTDAASDASRPIQLVDALD